MIEEYPNLLDADSLLVWYLSVYGLPVVKGGG